MKLESVRLLSKKVLVIFSLLGAIMLVLSEGDSTTYAFTGFIFCTCSAFFLLISRRLIFSVMMTWLLFFGITSFSLIVYRHLCLSLTVFDVFFYLRNLHILSSMSGYFLAFLILGLIVIVASIILGLLIYKSEKTIGFSRKVLFLMLSISALGVYLTYPAIASHQDYCICTKHRTSCFFASLINIQDVIGKNQLKQSLTKIQSTEKYTAKIYSLATTKPDIIVILMESAVQPSLYPEISAPTRLKDSFKSIDQKIHSLHIETFGGGTWITTAGLMTSLPTTAFGWLRPYFPVVFEGRIHHSLPQFLKNHGYATAAISPTMSSFINEGRFLTSLGFETYLDYQAIGAKSMFEPDAFYFDAALKFIEHHHCTDQRPLFLYVQTMGTHWPYNFRAEPTTKLADEPFGNDDQMNEYLRRLFIQRLGLSSFKKQLATHLSHKAAEAIVVEFGDHQPILMLPYAQARENPTVLKSFDSILSTTYYTITPINRQLTTPIPNISNLDIMYLAPTVLESAGLPLDDVYQDLIEMRDHAATTVKKQFYLKKLVNSELLSF